MPVIAIRCPHCGGIPQLDDDREFGYCSYCGTRIKIENHVVNNNFDHKATQISRLKSLARTHMDRGDYGNALEVLKDISGMDDTDPDYYLLLMELHYRRGASGGGLLSGIEESRSAADLISGLHGKYARYSGDRRTVADVVRSFGLPPYDVDGELRAKSRLYAASWDGGWCSQPSEYRNHVGGGRYETVSGVRNFGLWAVENCEKMMESPPYECNIAPLLVLDKVAGYKWNVTGANRAKEIMPYLSEHRPEYLELLNSGLFCVSTRGGYIKVGTKSDFRGGEWKYEDVYSTFKVVYDAEITGNRGIDIRPVMRGWSVLLTEQSIAEFERRNTIAVTKGLVFKKPDAEGQRRHDEDLRRYVAALREYRRKAVEYRERWKYSQLRGLCPGWVWQISGRLSASPPGTFHHQS